MFAVLSIAVLVLVAPTPDAKWAPIEMNPNQCPTRMLSMLHVLMRRAARIVYCVLCVCVCAVCMGSAFEASTGRLLGSSGAVALGRRPTFAAIVLLEQLY